MVFEYVMQLFYVASVVRQSAILSSWLIFVNWHWDVPEKCPKWLEIAKKLPESHSQDWLDDRGAGRWTWMDEVSLSHFPHSRPLRHLIRLIFSGNRRACRLPAKDGDHFHCTVEPLSSHIRGQLKFPEIARKYLQLPEKGPGHWAKIA